MRAWLIVGLAAAALAGCMGGSRAAPGSSEPCPPDQRKVFLQTDLTDWVPSVPFDVAAGTQVWVRVTKRPTAAGGLFGGLAGVAELHRIGSVAAPAVSVGAGGERTSTDPPIVVKKALQWVRTDIPAGSWRLYSASNPAIELIGCPPR